jgi:hypothetical protein
MDTSEKGLQKLTDSKPKIAQLLAIKQLKYKDLEILNDEEQNEFWEFLNLKLRELKGEELDEFLQRVERITPRKTRNDLWERNHAIITEALNLGISLYGRMPTKLELEQQTELSRQTINKHLKEYSTHPIFIEQTERLRFLTSDLIARLFHFAVKGDMRAARLFLEVTGSINGQQSNNTFIRNQNNYLQINGIVLNQEIIKRLNPEQLNNIEAILKKGVPKLQNEVR